jgi:type II restriction/modification system DNA methylase subunit YeeA
MKRNGFDAARNPILKPLETIECRDALLNPDDSEAEWPKVDVIVGNPPFLGAKLMKRRMGVQETEALRAAFDGRLAGFTDLVCYWFEKARVLVARGEIARVGLVATSSIRGGTNRPVLDRIARDLRIYNAWSELPWVVEGARVEVSIICFAMRDSKIGCARLDGKDVEGINPDLSTGTDLTRTKSLRENDNVSFLGIQKSGPFDVNGATARVWLQFPTNVNGKSNSEILKPYWNGEDVTGRPRDIWFIDLPLGLSESQASQFGAPFEHLLNSRDEDGKSLKELRVPHGFASATERWWEPWRPRPDMRQRIEALPRYIATPETSEYRLFVWLSFPVLPDKNLIVIARSDDASFGILHSRFHELWALRLGTSLEDRPRYTSTTTFATYPFPEGLTPDISSEDYANDPRAIVIAEAARILNELREGWLNPEDLVERVQEVVPGYPDRIVPNDDHAAGVLRRRTLTTLYNERPAWLDHAHHTLDEAVAAASGWPADLSDGEILERLFKLNQKRAAAESKLVDGGDKPGHDDEFTAHRSR